MNTASALSQAVADVMASTIRERGMTQREVAEAAGIPLVSLNRKLTGHRPFTVIELAEVARAVGTSPLDVMLRAERMALTAAA